jgi:hypothetical protein
MRPQHFEPNDWINSEPKRDLDYDRNDPLERPRSDQGLLLHPETDKRLTERI